MQVKRKKDEEPLTEETIKKLSMKCVLATCATPAPRCRSDTIGPAMNSQDDKFRLMCDKLHFHSRPNQKNLIEQLEKEEICDDLPSLFTEIQNIMIGEQLTSHPLQGGQTRHGPYVRPILSSLYM
eukprot:TRINITY_DN4576_c0_g1_i1.p1 TRINITY_DN4576_c0_g1~~TRINITY_DN4576_c0_g1_i1.p1  ORF type:complete len:142 (-),score=15.36 TRINITY_DN4576_c0_g1_i1:77-451(-)